MDEEQTVPSDFLFAVQVPAQAGSKAQTAAAEIQAELREQRVHVAQADDARAITDFAKTVTLN